MDITDVRVKLASREGDRLKAYCTIVFDGEFVVRDVRIVDGTNGLFVAMPSRKLTVPCEKCGFKNPLLARFCNDCGCKLARKEPVGDPDNRLRLHRDIAHPITGECRELLQQRVVEAYEAERDQLVVDNDAEFTEEEQEELVDAADETETETEDEDEVEVEVETAEEEEVAEEQSDDPNEYGDLIASLRRHPGQTEPEPAPPRERERERAPKSVRPAARGRSREGDRSRDSRPPRGGGRPRSEGDRKPRPPAGQPRTREEAPAPAMNFTTKTPETDIPAFGAMIGDEDRATPEPVSKVAAKSKVPPTPEPPKKQEDKGQLESIDQNDEGSSFGAGLL